MSVPSFAIDAILKWNIKSISLCTICTENYNSKVFFYRADVYAGAVCVEKMLCVIFSSSSVIHNDRIYLNVHTAAE